ncbi:MAG: DUF4870 domain-containing protein [Armatimonadota bacterium]|nr:DUF4870 domain-containing protein [Armatimonadota bacterium]
MESMDRDSRTWALVSHLSGLAFFVFPFVGNIVGPLVIYLIKGETSDYVKRHAKESLNFQISIDIYLMISGLLAFALIGFVTTPALMLFDIIVIIIATIRANDGEHYGYPLAIRFVK